jgi:mono/diheme cytochrome c family protein
MNVARVLLPVALAVLVSASFRALPSAAQTTSGPYTAAQATAGAAIYTAQCSMCHGDKLEGVSGPQLAGKDFISKWNGQTADDLRDVIATQMPLTAPGSLKPAEVMSVLSYILQQNKYPAGTAPLTPAVSKTVKIAKQGS